MFLGPWPAPSCQLGLGSANALPISFIYFHPGYPGKDWFPGGGGRRISNTPTSRHFSGEGFGWTGALWTTLTGDQDRGRSLCLRSVLQRADSQMDSGWSGLMQHAGCVHSARSLCVVILNRWTTTHRKMDENETAD